MTTNSIEYQRAYYVKNRDKILARYECPRPGAAVEHDRLRARRYGLSLEESRVLGATTTCQICGSDDTGVKTQKRFNVDHCHRTGKVRGVLCCHCNLGLGRFKDDPALMRAAADYIEKHERETRA